MPTCCRRRRADRPAVQDQQLDGAPGLEGLSDDEAWQQLEGKGNPIAWIVGHLTETRAQMLGLLGAPWDAGWGRQFKRGGELYDRFAYPSRRVSKRDSTRPTSRCERPLRR